MTIASKALWVELDFERPRAPWVLLVVDDRWDVVQRMINGYTANDERFAGLGDDCVKAERVSAYWSTRARGQKEPNLKALLLLPYIAFREEAIGRVAFTPFPADLTADSVVSFQERQPNSLLAALIDVANDAGSESVAFVETWETLNASGVSPVFSRAQFTRGGASHHLPSWAQENRIPTVKKVFEADGVSAFETEFHRWWGTVLCSLRAGAKVFSKTKEYDEHNPFTLLKAPPRNVSCLVDELILHDATGVWRWCKTLLSDSATDSLQKAWLAGKALQTSVADSSSVALCAVIGACHGAAHLAPEVRFEVESRLGEVDPKDEESINDLRVLGSLTIGEGSKYSEFIEALRIWLTLPSQYKAGRSRIHRVTISHNAERAEAEIAFHYDKPLPRSIFSPGPAHRPGSTTEAWKSLSAFAKAVIPDDNPVIRLRFPWQQSPRLCM